MQFSKIIVFSIVLSVMDTKNTLQSFIQIYLNHGRAEISCKTCFYFSKTKSSLWFSNQFSLSCNFPFSYYKYYSNLSVHHSPHFISLKRIFWFNFSSNWCNFVVLHTSFKDGNILTNIPSLHLILPLVKAHIFLTIQCVFASRVDMAMMIFLHNIINIEVASLTQTRKLIQILNPLFPLLNILTLF